MGEKVYVKMKDSSESKVYVPEVHPGHSCWVSVWPSAAKKGEYYLSFHEKRRGNNPYYRPIPIEFYESGPGPIKYPKERKDVITEQVVMHSKDNGQIWKEVGRSFTKAINLFAFASLPNGDIIRAIDNMIECYYPEEQPEFKIQKSSDNGNTWEDYSLILKGFYSMGYRMKRLRDGTLILLSPYIEAYGPGKKMEKRAVAPRANVRIEHQNAFYISHDDGKNWSGPVTVLPGIDAWEPDFVELASGDLLVVNSSIQGGPQVRQYVYRTSNRFLPGPVYNIVSGRAPETFVVTEDGLLVGATRGNIYTFSADEGENWHEVAGDRTKGYQPMIIRLDDGSFLNMWHAGYDEMFGESDQYIGKHEFKLEVVDLPKKMTITINREMDKEKTQYINLYTAALKADGKPLAGRKVKFAVSERYTPANAYLDPRVGGIITELLTDQNGEAKINLANFDNQRNVHYAHRIIAYYIPSEGDEDLKPCESNIEFSYGVTPVRRCENPHKVFWANGKIYIVKEAIEKYPELKTFINIFRDKDIFTADEVIKSMAIDSPRVEEILGFLTGEFIIRKEDNNGKYIWLWGLVNPLIKISPYVSPTQESLNENPNPMSYGPGKERYYSRWLYHDFNKNEPPCIVDSEDDFV